MSVVKITYPTPNENVTGALVGTPYSLQFEVVGGTPPYNWNYILVPPTGGSISWINFDPINGLLTGTPTGGGQYTFIELQVSDSLGNIYITNFRLQILDLTSSIPYTNLITSEHNQKPNFMMLVGILTSGVGDVTNTIQSLIPAFSLTTAVGAQLDIVGLWIGQSRIIPNVLVTGFFGFSELASGDPDGLQEPFGELTNPSIGGIWYNLGQQSSSTTVLSDVAYLTLLKAKITENQWDGTLSGMEEALLFITGVNCSIADPGDLNLTITVPLPITPLEQALLTSLDIIPRPAGVLISGITFTA